MEAQEARKVADRLRNIEAQLKNHERRLEVLTSQQGTPSQSQRHVEEAAFDAIAPSNRKSSVASTEVPAGDDDALTMAPRRYQVDYITESTPCELTVKVVT